MKLMRGLKSSEWHWLSLETVNAMTNEAKTGYDSSIAPAIDFELVFGGIGAIRWLRHDLEAIWLLDTFNPA